MSRKGMLKYNVTKEEFENYYKDHSIFETAYHFGIPEGTVFIYLKRFGIPSKVDSRREVYLGIKNSLETDSDYRESFLTYIKTHTDIDSAEHFDCTVEFIVGVRQTYNIDNSKRRVNELYKSQEFINYCKDHTSKEIAERFGKTDYVIRNVCRINHYEYKKSTNHKGNGTKRRGTRDDMIKYLSEKFLYNDIAEVFNISPATISYIVNGKRCYKNPSKLR